MKKLCTNASIGVTLGMLLFGACQNDKTTQPNPEQVGPQAAYLRFEKPEDFKKALLETSKMSREELDIGIGQRVLSHYEVFMNKL